MKNKIAFTCLISFLLTSLHLQAEEPALAIPSDSSGSYYICKSGASVRTIRISKKGNVCKTFYTKEGVDAMVSKSSNPQTCGDVAGRIKTNLESSNWKCKDISNSRVSSNFN